MLKIQSSQKFMLAVLAFSSITVGTAFAATANILGSQPGFYTQHQSAKFKISQNDISLPSGPLTPEQEAKLDVFTRAFSEKITAFQQQHNKSTPEAERQIRNITREYMIGFMSVLTPSQREQFRKELGSKRLRELGLN
jgi:Spy/CpxP family protein refolding chaperone